MSDLYSVRVAARPDERTIELDIKVVHPDAMHIPATPGFALMLLHDTAEDAPLAEQLELHTVMDPAWSRAYARAFVESVELVSTSNEPPSEALSNSQHGYWRTPERWLEGRLRIRTTHAAWVEHVPSAWDTASFDPATDYDACSPALPDEDPAITLEVDFRQSSGFMPIPNLLLAGDVEEACPAVLWIPRYGARAYQAFEQIPGREIERAELHAWVGQPLLWHDGTRVYVGVLAKYGLGQLALVSVRGGSRTTYYYGDPSELTWIGTAMFRRGTPRLPTPPKLESLLAYASPVARCAYVDGRSARLLVYQLGRESDAPQLDSAADVLRLIALPTSDGFGDFDAATAPLGCALRRELEAHDLGSDTDIYPVVAHGFIAAFEVDVPREARELDLDTLDADALTQFIATLKWPCWTVDVTVTDEAWLEHLPSANPWSFEPEELDEPEAWDGEPRTFDPIFDVPMDGHDDDDDDQEAEDDDDDDDPSAGKSTLRRHFELPSGARKGSEPLAANDPRAVLREHGMCEDLGHPLAKDNFENACKLGNVEAVRAYAALGIELNSHADITGETPLIRAAEGDRAEVIRALAAAGVDLEGRDGGGDTALMTAVNWKHPNALRALIEVGAKLDAPDNWENYPLVKALEEDEDELVELLLAAGASVNAGAATQDSALQWCLRSGNDERLRQLLDQTDADANLRNSSGDTLLHIAADKRELGAAEILLEHGADPTLGNRWGWNPRELAVAVEAEELADLFESRGAPLNKTDELAYFTAIKRGKTKEVRAALERGVELETRDHVGRTGFLVALSEQQREIAELLRERGADVDARDDRDRNALSYTTDIETYVWLLRCGVSASLRDSKGVLQQPGVEAVLESDDPKLLDALLDPRTNWPDLSDLSSCHTSMIWGDFEDRLEQRAETLRRLGAAGADLHAPDDNGETLLHGYINRGHEPCAMALIEVGVDIEATDKNFVTPLHKSCGEFRNLDEQARITAALLDAGADYVTCEWLARSAWDQADSSDSDGCKAVLEQRFEQTLGATPAESAARTNFESFMHWVRQRRHDVVHELLAAGYDPNPPARDSHGLPPGKLPLTQAITNGDLRMLEILLDGGADVNLAQHYGSTALSYAVSGQQPEMVALLLARGANPNALDDSGNTTMNTAAGRGRVDLLEMLHAAGGSVQPRPAGRLPLYVAARGGHFEAAEWLLAHGADIDARNEGRVTALHIAIEEDEVEIALALIAAGADVHVQTSDEQRTTALISATKKGRAELIQALLAAGADPHVQDADGQSAIDHAAYRDELRELFPEAGSGPIFMPIKRELPPLLRAIHVGDDAAFEQALAERDDIDARNYRGDTALMLATAYRRVDWVGRLLDAGADLGARNAKGDHAWSYAFCSGADHLRLLYEQRGFEGGMDALNQMASQSMRRDAAREAINAGDIARVAKLIDEHELDVDMLAAWQRPLELALARGDHALIRLLLAKGADPSLPDASGVALSERLAALGFDAS